MAEPLLDCDRLRSLRLEVGLSQRALGRRVGLSPTAIRALEDKEQPNHHQLSLAVVDRVAKALGVPVAQLFAPDGGEAASSAEGENEPKSGADAAKLGALVAAVDDRLSRRDVAGAFGWGDQRVAEATKALERELTRVGLRFPSGPGTLTFLPRRNLLAPAEVQAADRALLVRGSLRVNEARLLRQVAEGLVDGRWEGKASNPQRVTLGRLLRLGLVVRDDPRSPFRLSEEAQISLLIDVDSR